MVNEDAVTHANRLIDARQYMLRSRCQPAVPSNWVAAAGISSQLSDFARESVATVWPSSRPTTEPQYEHASSDVLGLGHAVRQQAAKEKG